MTPGTATLATPPQGTSRLTQVQLHDMLQDPLDINLAGMDLSGMTLTIHHRLPYKRRVDLTGADLTGARIRLAVRNTEVMLDDAALTGALITELWAMPPGFTMRDTQCNGVVAAAIHTHGGDVSGLDLTGATIGALTIWEADAARLQLPHAHINSLVAVRARVTRGDFTNATIKTASIRDSRLAWVDTTGARFGEVTLSGNSISGGIDFPTLGAPPRNRTDPLVIDRSPLVPLNETHSTGATINNSVITEAGTADLAYLTITGSVITELQCTNRSFTRVRITGSFISSPGESAYITSSILDGVDLTATTVDRVQFVLTELRDATLRGAVFIGCHFDGCDFSRADMTDATFIGCVFQDCIFSRVDTTRTVFHDTTFQGPTPPGT